MYVGLAAAGLKELTFQFSLEISLARFGGSVEWSNSLLSFFPKQNRIGAKLRYVGHGGPNALVPKGILAADGLHFGEIICTYWLYQMCSGLPRGLRETSACRSLVASGNAALYCKSA